MFVGIYTKRFVESGSTSKLTNDDLRLLYGLMFMQTITEIDPKEVYGVTDTNGVISVNWTEPLLISTPQDIVDTFLTLLPSYTSATDDDIVVGYKVNYQGSVQDLNFTKKNIVNNSSLSDESLEKDDKLAVNNVIHALFKDNDQEVLKFSTTEGSAKTFIDKWTDLEQSTKVMVNIFNDGEQNPQSLVSLGDIVSVDNNYFIITGYGVNNNSLMSLSNLSTTLSSGSDVKLVTLCQSGDTGYSEPSSSTGVDAAQAVAAQFANQILAAAGIDASTASTAINEYIKAISNGDDSVTAITKVATDLSIDISALAAAVITAIIQIAGAAGIDTSDVVAQYNDIISLGVDTVTAFFAVANALGKAANSAITATGITPNVVSQIASQYFIAIANGLDPVTALNQVSGAIGINVTGVAAVVVSSLSDGIDANTVFIATHVQAAEQAAAAQAAQEAAAYAAEQEAAAAQAAQAVQEAAQEAAEQEEAAADLRPNIRGFQPFINF